MPPSGTAINEERTVGFLPKNPADVLARADRTMENVDSLLGDVRGLLTTVDATLVDVSGTLTTVSGILAETKTTLGDVKALLVELHSRLALLDQVPVMADQIAEIHQAVRAGAAA